MCKSKLAAWAKIKAGAGYLYAAEVDPSHNFALIKIGFALDPAKRMKHLAGLYKRKVRLIAAMPGTYSQERFLHGKLRDYRVGRTHDELYAKAVLSHPAIPAELRAA